METFIAQPYIPNAGPDYPASVRFEHSDGRVKVVSVESDGSEVVRFDAGPYRMGAAASWADARMASDVVGFAVAYVERPEEFDRDESDTEQVHAAWWRRHGDALACVTEGEE